MKKRLALLLVLCLGIGLSGPALAEEGTEEETLAEGAWEYRLLEDDTAVITGYKHHIGELEDLVIPEQLGGRKVTAIGRMALYGCETPRTVTVPEGVTSIGEGAFMRCRNLKEATVGNSVTEVGENPFAFCESLTAVHLPPDHPCLSVVDGVLFGKDSGTLYCYPAGLGAAEYAVPPGTRAIGKWAFCRSRLEKVTIPDSVTEIGDRAFYECKSLKEITIPGSISQIGTYTFGECLSLARVTIPGSVAAIGEKAFYDCRKLAEITIPEGVVSIGDEAFSYCSALKEVTIPDSVVSVGKSAFTICTKLREVTIGKGVTSIGANPFSNCVSLTAIHVSPDHPFLDVEDNALFIREPRTLVCWPAGLEVAEYTVPQGTEAIGEWAFEDVFIGRIVIPDSVRAIGDGAFGELDDILLIVGRGSAAEQYCLENDRTYRYPDGE